MVLRPPITPSGPHLCGVVECGRDLPAQHQRQPLDAVKVGVLYGHDAWGEGGEGGSGGVRADAARQGLVKAA